MPPPTDAVVTAESMSGPLRIDWTYRVGDTWSSEILAVIVDGEAVQLDDGPDTDPGWVVLAQARFGAQVIASWSTADGTVALGTADVQLEDGTTITTSTVQLNHDPGESRERGPFGRSPIEVEVSRYEQPGDADPAESYTIAAGWVTALPDGAHR